MSENKSREIIELDDISHMLIRPNTFIGSIQPTEYEEWILTEEGLIEKQKITYVSGLLKIINEILDNSIDEGLRTNWKYSNKISIKVFEDKITITDNGRGLPVKKDNNGNWMPVSAFCKSRAGSNFSDDNRETIGMNGVGSFATNVFSKAFEVITCDGKAKMKVVCKNNLSEEKHSLLEATSETGTRVSFIPDYERFSVEGITSEIETMIKTRLKFLSWFYPKCEFKYNGEKMNIKAKEIASMFPTPSVQLVTEKVYILAYASEEPESLSYVNGLSIRRGGTHIDYILNTVTTDLREKLIKKYKNIKPLDIKNRLGLVVFFKDFPNCQFDSQTKELLSNNEKDIKAYLENVDLTSKISKKILLDKDFTDNITDIFKLKEELAEKKELAKLSKKVKTVDSDKYFPPISHSGKKYLFLTEGYSAFSGISPVLGRKGCGYYSLKGKILNVYETSLKKALENTEIHDIVNILDLDLTNPNTDMSFEKVVILSDQDMDGVHIASLLVTLFNKVCPKIVQDGRICRLNTPLLIGKKGNSVIQYFYEFPKTEELDSKLTWKYVKGLGSHNVSELKQIIEKEGGLENMMVSFQYDSQSETSIKNWMGGDSTERKKRLLGKEFNIAKM